MALGLAAPAVAQDAQFRELSLVDGRTLVVTVLATEAIGMRVALPQGEMLVGFDMLTNMSTSTLEAYEAQPPWQVYVDAPPGHDVSPLLGKLPGVQVTAVGEVGPGMTEGSAAAAAACDGDLSCIGQHVEPGTWVMTVSQTDTGVDLMCQLSGTRTRGALRGIEDTSAALWDAAHELLGLTVTGSPPKAGVKRPVRTASVRQTAKRSPFVPLPGYAAMGSDPARVAAAWGVVLPAATAWVGVVGSASQTPVEHIALGLSGVYAITVATNVALAPRGAVVSVTPLPGGAGLTVGLRR